jgi:hypothetical protein
MGLKNHDGLPQAVSALSANQMGNMGRKANLHSYFLKCSTLAFYQKYHSRKPRISCQLQVDSFYITKTHYFTVFHIFRTTQPVTGQPSPTGRTRITYDEKDGVDARISVGAYR